MDGRTKTIDEILDSYTVCLFARQDGRCHLCGCAVAVTDQEPEELSAVLKALQMPDEQVDPLLQMYSVTGLVTLRGWVSGTWPKRGHGAGTFIRPCLRAAALPDVRWKPPSVRDQVEFLPGADGGAVGDEGLGAGRLRGDVHVGLGAQADAAVAVVDQMEGLPGTDGGAVGDQWLGPGIVGGDVVAVGVGAQGDVAVALVDLVKLLRGADRRPVGGQRLGAGGGTDIAVESADIVLLRAEVTAVLDARDISGRAYRRTRTNVTLAFTFNGLGIPLATTGLVSPVWAMVAMAASVTTIFLNSLGTRPSLLFQAISSVGRRSVPDRAEQGTGVTSSE
jgi:hypothetical protein